MSGSPQERAPREPRAVPELPPDVIEAIARSFADAIVAAVKRDQASSPNEGGEPRPDQRPAA